MKNALKYLKTYIIHQKELDYKPQQGGAKPVDNLQRWSTCRTRDHPEIRNPFTDQGEIRPRNLRFKCIVHAQLDCSKSLSKPKTLFLTGPFRVVIQAIKDMPYSIVKMRVKRSLFSRNFLRSSWNVCVKLQGLSKQSNTWIKDYIIVNFSVIDKLCSSKHLRT